MKKLSTLILALFITVACIGQKANLKLNLEEGKTYTQNMEMESTINQNVGGQDMEIIMKTSSITKYKIRQILDEGYLMELSYSKVAMSMGLPQGSVEFSSENPKEGDVFSSIFSSIIDKPFEAVVTPLGRVVKLSGLDKLWEDMINNAEEIPEAQKQQMQKQIKNMYGEKSMRGSMESAMAIYPEKPVKKGAQWTVNTKIETGMVATSIATYTYIGKEGDLARIEGLAKIITEDTQEFSEVNGMEMRFDLEGQATSSFLINRKSGWVMEANIGQEIEGTSFIKESVQVPNGMEIPIKIKTEQVLKGDQ